MLSCVNTPECGCADRGQLTGFRQLCNACPGARLRRSPALPCRKRVSIRFSGAGWTSSLKTSSRDLLGAHSPLTPELRQRLSFLCREPVVCGARYPKHLEIPQDRIIAQQAFGQEALAFRQSDLVKQDTNGRHGRLGFHVEPCSQAVVLYLARPAGQDTYSDDSPGAGGSAI